MATFITRLSTCQRVPQSHRDKYEDSDSISSSAEGLITHKLKDFHKPPATTRWLWIAIHLCFISIYTAAFIIAFNRLTVPKSSTSHSIHSPAWKAVSKERGVYDGRLRNKSPYSGLPSPEGDAAWSKLLQYSNIRVSGTDLAKINKTSIPVPGEEDSYWVELSVTHELHCIKRLRQFWFSDYYFPDLTEEDRRLNRLHNDHCLEVLRQAAICHADVSLITMRWDQASVFPKADFSSPHECTNWDRLYKWQKERSVDMMKPGFLVHPTLGPPYPDGRYTGIGATDDEDGAVDELKIAHSMLSSD